MGSSDHHMVNFSSSYCLPDLSGLKQENLTLLAPLAASKSAVGVKPSVSQHVDVTLRGCYTVAEILGVTRHVMLESVGLATSKDEDRMVDWNYEKEKYNWRNQNYTLA